MTSEDTRSETFKALRAQNLEMLRLWRSATTEGGTKDEHAIEAVTRFTRSIVAAGARLAAGFERNDTQEMLDYWYAQLMSAKPTDPAAAWPPMAPYVGDRAVGGSEAESAASVAEQADKLRVAREQVRLSALARQWSKSGRTAGYLLSGSALETAEPYAQSDDKALADFVKASMARSGRVRRVRWVAGSVLATLVGVAGLMFYLYTEIQRSADREILSIANPLSSPSTNAASLRWLSRYRAVLPPQDLSGMTFHDLDVGNLTFVAANFTASRFERISLRDGDFSSASFIESTIGGEANDFGNAHLRLAQFQGAQIANTSFAGADLYRASFNDAKLKNVDFSGALLRKTYLLTATIDNDFRKTFKDTAWWLAGAWSWSDLKTLLALPVDAASLKASGAFCRDLQLSEQRLDASSGGEFDRARSLNGIAWTLATWGIYLAPGERNERAGEKCPTRAANAPDNALAAAEEAIAIFKKAGVPRNAKERARYEDDLANFEGTHALVLMQLDDRTHPKAASEAFDILQKIPADKRGGGTLFLYALALYGRGGEANETTGKATMTEALKSYFPSHEFHLLKTHIKGDLKKQLDVFICTKRQSCKKPIDCASEATP